MLRRKGPVKIIGCLLAIVLMAIAATGLYKAEAALVKKINYYSGTENNNGSNGHIISSQDKWGVKDLLGTINDAVSATKQNDGTKDVAKYQDDGYVFFGWKIGNQVYESGADVTGLARGQDMTAVAQWAEKSNLTLNGTPISAAETPITNGKVSVSAYPAPQGKALTVTLTPSKGYELDSFKIDTIDVVSQVVTDKNGISTYTIPAASVDADVAIVASFKKKTFTLTISADANTNVTPVAGEYIVEYGANQDITITAKDGYEISSVKVDGKTKTFSNNVLTVSNITSNTTIIITTKQKTYEITASVSGTFKHGSVSPTRKTVAWGDTYTLTLDPDDGYQVGTLELDNIDVTDEIIDNQYTITNVTAKHSLVVKYETIKTHIITINATEGVTVDPAESSLTVHNRETKTIGIEAKEGYHLTSVKVNGIESIAAVILDNKLTLPLIKEDKNITITAEKNQYNIHTEIIPHLDGNHGTITKSGTAKHGESFTINVTPDEHYELDYLTVDTQPVVVTDNTYTINNITKDTLVVARFKKKPEYNFTIEASAGITTTPAAGIYTVNHGETKTVAVSIDEGYEITSVKINGIPHHIGEDDNSLTIPNISSNITVSIAAKKKTFTIGATSTDILRGIVKPVLDTVEYGQSYTLEIFPSYGFELSTLLLDNNDVVSQIEDNKFTIDEVKSNHLIVTSFKQKTYTINISAPENVTTNPSASTIFADYLENKTIKIAPNEGYHLTSVKVNNIEVLPLMIGDNLTLLAINEDKNIAIQSEKNQYNIYTEVIGGHGAITEDSNAEYGEEFTINLFPDTGYKLATLTINGYNVTDSIINNSYTIPEVKSTIIARATYKKIEYLVDTQVDGIGGHISRSQLVKYGDGCIIRVRADANYIVDSFTIDGDPAELYGGFYYLGNVTANHEVVVSFKHVSRTLTIDSVEGATIAPTGSIEVEHGSSQDISIQADHNYEIESVSVNGVPQSLPLANDTLHLENITESTAVVVTTKKVAHDITTTVDGEHGTVSAGGNVADKSAFTITATPDVGYKLETIKVNGEEVEFSDNSYTIASVESDTEVVVAFSKYYPAITISVSEGVNVGDIIPEQVPYDSSLEIHLVPALGYYLSSLKINGIEQELPLEQDMLQLQNITEDTIIEVSAKKETYKIIEGDHQTFKANLNSSLTITSNGNCNDFVDVFIDEQVVDKKFYTVTCGSTIIDFSHDYAISLNEGEHNARLLYINGNYAEASFIIDKTTVGAPDTGVNSKEQEETKTCVIASITLILMTSLVIFIRRKQHRRQ